METESEITFTYHETSPYSEDWNGVLGRIHKAPQQVQHTLLLFHTKCTDGAYCKDDTCISLHPGQNGWSVGLVKQIAELCPNEEHGTCSKKCGGQEGYCPYEHCIHDRAEYYNKWTPWDGTCCGKEECMGHCESCGLATEKERENVLLRTRREWGENR